MCGFLGFVGFGPPPDLVRAGARILRRGSDSVGYWTSTDQQARIIHARLAISDLRATAAQPLSDTASGLTIAFVGEIYNHLELRAELKDHSFETSSDTETLLALLTRHEVETVLPLLRGMFALIVVDQKKHRVVLARDPVGKKPLFLMRRPEGAYFGSSVLAIAAASGVSSIDEEAAARWWAEGTSPPDTSVLQGCAPLRPGEVVVLSWDGKLKERKRVTPVQRAPITSISVPEALEEVERLLRVAVKQRLSDNPNPVALLSGGIDSTVVCKYALEAGATRLLTLGTRWFKSPDEKYAREAAQRLGASLEVITLGEEPVPVRVARMAALQDEPLGMISFIPLANLAEAARKQSRVLLTGDGGDEAFGGYGRPPQWIADTPSARHHDFPSGPDFPEWMSAYGRKAAGYDQVSHGFAKLDRATAEQALEARCPLLAWDLVAFARALPKEVFFCKPVAKPLLKGLLKGWPESFIERPKVGFMFRIRWIWMTSLYAGLREAIREDAHALFRSRLPADLQRAPRDWTTPGVFRCFEAAYRLYVWSAFLDRLAAPQAAPDLAEGVVEEGPWGRRVLLSYPQA